MEKEEKRGIEDATTSGACYGRIVTDTPRPNPKSIEEFCTLTNLKL